MRRLCNEYELVTKEERKLTDVMIGYLDPAEHVPSASEMAAAAEQRAEQKGDDDEEEEANVGPDPVEAKKRFTALKRQCTKTEKSDCCQGPRPQRRHHRDEQTR